MASRDGRSGRRVQLHRAVAKLGWGSRGQAWAWIQAGEVRVDGQIVSDPLTWVDLDSQQITRNECSVPSLAGPLTLALNKPRGIVTTRRDERGRRTVYDLLPPDLPWIFPAGRLDRDSEGLLILTSESDLAVRLTEPQHHIVKTYRVTVAGRPTAEALEQLRHGVELSDGRTRPALVELLEAWSGDHASTRSGDHASTRSGDHASTQVRSVVEIRLTEGRNRQVRRMLAAVGHRVRRLLRVAIGGYELGDLPSGAYRTLDAADRERLLG